MDDLVFKVIPAEGFDHQGESDRISNPTPTRKGKQPDGAQAFPETGESAAAQEPVIPQPVLPLRLENADVSETAAAAARFSDLPGMTVGRASCPTPTRRAAAPQQRSDTVQPVFQDPNARLSNPTPSRRRGALQPSPAPAPAPAAAAVPQAPAVPVQSAESRASNPTPRRRASAPAAAEPAAAAPDETGSRLSNPTPSSRR